MTAAAGGSEEPVGVTVKGTAVVTGAGAGLGAEFVRQLRGLGWHVVGVDLDGADRRVDVRDGAALRSLAQELRPSLWVNNAAVLGSGDAATQSDEVVDRVVEVNLLGVIRGTRAAVAVMRQHAGGQVINVGSLASWTPVPGESVYAATKAGVLSFTLGLEAELRAQGERRVRFTVVCPDGMLTPMIRDVVADPAVVLTFSGLRLVTPEEVVVRALSTLRRPRRVVSVPRWRGAEVRLIGAVPDFALALHPVIAWVGRRNQARLVARLGNASEAAPV